MKIIPIEIRDNFATCHSKHYIYIVQKIIVLLILSVYPSYLLLHEVNLQSFKLILQPGQVSVCHKYKSSTFYLYPGN